MLVSLDDERLLAALRVARQGAVGQPKSVVLVKDVDDPARCNDFQRTRAEHDENRFAFDDRAGREDPHARALVRLSRAKPRARSVEVQRTPEHSPATILPVAGREVDSLRPTDLRVGGTPCTSQAEDVAEFVRRRRRQPEHAASLAP